MTVRFIQCYYRLIHTVSHYQTPLLLPVANVMCMYINQPCTNSLDQGMHLPNLVNF